MAKPRNKYRDYLMYIGLRLFAMFIHMFNYRANYRTAGIIGNLLYRFDKRHRQRAIEHLRRSFPDWDERKLQEVAKASMRNLVYLGVEVLFTTRLITPNCWMKHVRTVNMSRALRMVVERKSGFVVATPHFGNWEVMGYILATLGFPMVAIARPLDNPYINDYILGVRERTGMSILHKKGATQSMDDILEAKGVLGFIADQDAGRKGVFVDFFGRKASTYKSLALMAINHNVPVIVGYAKRLGEDFNFEIGTQRIIMPEEWIGREDPMLWLTQEWTTAIEEVVRKAPEQYLWVHRRWKHRPPGEPTPADGIA